MTEASDCGSDGGVFEAKRMLLGQAYAQLLSMESTNSDTWVLGFHPQVLLLPECPTEEEVGDPEETGDCFVLKMRELFVENCVNNPRVNKVVLNYGADIMPAAFVVKLLELQEKARETKPEFAFEISWNVMKDQTMKWWIDYLGLFSDVGVSQLSIGPEFFENCTAEQLSDIRSLIAVSRISEVSICAINSAESWAALELIAEAFSEVKGLKTLSIAEKLIPVNLVTKVIRLALKNPSLDSLEIGLIEDPDFDFSDFEFSDADVSSSEAPRVHLTIALFKHRDTIEFLRFVGFLKQIVPVKKVEVSFNSPDVMRPFIAQCIPKDLIEFFPGFDLDSDLKEENDAEAKVESKMPTIEFGTEFDMFEKTKRLVMTTLKIANPSILSRCRDLEYLGIVINPEVKLEEIISTLSSLKCLKQLSVMVDGDSFALNPEYHWNFVESIAYLSVEKIDIDGPEEFWSNADTFKKLISLASSLKSVSFEGTSRGSLLSILHILKGNKTLREFICIPSDWSCEASAYSSQEEDSAEDSDAALRLSEEMAELAVDILASNKTLTTLDIHLNPASFADSDSDRLDRLLKSNSSITSLTFDWDMETLDPFFSISEPILSWLESNKRGAPIP